MMLLNWAFARSLVPQSASMVSVGNRWDVILPSRTISRTKKKPRAI